MQRSRFPLAVLLCLLPVAHLSAQEIVEGLRRSFPPVAVKLSFETELAAASVSIGGTNIRGFSPRFPSLSIPDGLASVEREAWLLHAERTREVFAPFFPAIYADPFVIRGRGIEVVLRPLGARQSVGSARPGLVIYPDAYPETDVLHSVANDRSEEFLHLRSADAPLRFDYELDAEGATPHAGEHGAIHFHSADHRGLTIEPPWLIDAAGRTSQSAVRWELSEDGRLLSLVVDPTGLTYPLLVDPTWVPAGNIFWAVTGHTATLLNDGRVLVVGGFDGSFHLAFAQLYDPATKSWSMPLNSPSYARSSHTATLLNDGRVLAAGGFNGSSYVWSVEIFDPATETWAAGSLLNPRSSHTVTLQPDGNVLIVGGFDGTSYITQSEVFNTAFLFSSPAPSLSLGGRANHSATLLGDGRLLVAGGRDGSGVLGSSEIYDFSFPSWTPALGLMSTARASHSSVLLGDGRVLAIGGSDGTSPLADTELFDPATETWSPSDSLSVPRERHGAAKLLDGRILVVGGFDGTNPLSSVEVFDPSTEAWSEEKSASELRADHTATTLQDGSVLVSGGRDELSFHYSTEVFVPDDDSAGRWVATGSMASDRFSHTATLLGDGGVLVVAGGPGGQSSAERYDPVTGTWASVGNISEGRSRHTATMLRNGRVLVAGGVLGGIPVGTCALYDPLTGTFTPTGSLNAPRSRHTATLLPDGQVLLAGGMDSSAALADAEIYDPSTGSWSTTGSLNGARQMHAATLLTDGRVLVTGGTGVSPLASAEIFDPVGGTWAPAAGLGQARSDHSATRLPNGRVVVVGGSGGPTAPTTAEIYDPTGNSWSAAAGGLSSPRTAHSATLLPSGNVLIVGGSAAANTAEIFESTAQTFRAVAGPGSPRASHTATLLANGDILVAGGSGPLRSAELYRSPGARWTPAASMGAARGYATSSLLPDGKVLVAGGYDGTAAQTSAVIYTPSADSWSPTGSLSIPRYTHQAVTLMDGSVLVSGGATPVITKTAEIYSPAAGTWRAVSDMNQTRWQHNMVLLGNGKVLVTGGANTATVEMYDPRSETWSYTTPLPAPRYDHGSVLLADGRVLVSGGFVASLGVKTALVFDPATETWSTTGSMNSARVRHSSTLLPDGKVLVVGTVLSAEIYDPGTGLWSPAGSLSTQRYDAHSAVLLPSGKVLVIGGSTPNEPTVFAELYDPVTNEWTSADSLITARGEHVTSLLPDGRILVAGGEFWTGSQWIMLSSAEVYDTGLGFQPAWRPFLSDVTNPLVVGSPMRASGSGFQGISPASGGNGAMESATNYPLLQLRRVDNEKTTFVPLDPTLGWNDASFDSLPLPGLTPGLTLATVVTNAIPSISRVLMVECAPPSIATQPASQFVCQGASAVFTVAATGECPSYRWRRNGVDLVDGGSYSGTATDTLSVGPIGFAEQGSYDVVVSSTCSSTAAVSSPAPLSLVQPPPAFVGLTSVSSQTGPCRMRLDWSPAASGCPTTPGILYNVYRSTVPGFTPGPGTLVASCVSDPFYEDSAGIANGETYHYIVRAEDSSVGFGGPCGGGQQDFNLIERSSLSVCSSTDDPPQPVPFFTATSTDRQNLLEWQNPLTGTYGSTRILYRTDMFPVGADDPLATVVGDRAGTRGTHDSVPHVLLTNGLRYYYAAYVDDGTGTTFSAGRFVSGIPMDTSGPVKWSYTTGATSLAPPGIGGAVHAVSNDRILHAMRRGASGGNWPPGWIPLAMNGPAQSRPPVVPTAIAAATRVVLLGSQDGHAYAVNADNGVLLWQSPTLGDMLQAAPAGIFDDLGGAPFDHVLVGTRSATSDNVFYALDAADGQVAWQFDNGGGAAGIGIISGGASVDYQTKRVFFASREKAGGSPDTVWALELTLGGLNYLWSTPVGNVDGSPILFGGRLYVGTNGSTLRALDPSTGGDEWLAPFVLGDGPVKGFVFPNLWTGDLYLSTTNKVWSIADGGTSGSKNWDVSLVYPSTPLPAPWLSKLFVGSGDGKLYQIDMIDQGLKSVVLGDGSGAVGTPAFDIAHSLLYVGTATGVIYAVAVPLP